MWILRVTVPLLAFICSVVLYHSATRKEVLPDLLHQKTGTYFERDGFCFAFVPDAAGGISSMHVYFQNRYAQACEAHVVLLGPREHVLENKRLPVGIDVEIACDGGAFGVCRVPWPIPRELQGMETHFETGCAVTYPGGRGKLVRFREGLRVGAPGGEQTLLAAARALALLSHATISDPPRLVLILPESVNEIAPSDAAIKSEILYRPTPPISTEQPIGIVRSETQPSRDLSHRKPNIDGKRSTHFPA